MWAVVTAAGAGIEVGVDPTTGVAAVHRIVDEDAVGKELVAALNRQIVNGVTTGCGAANRT